MLLMMRNGLSDWGRCKAGVAGLGETVVVAAGIGLGVAAVRHPLADLADRPARHRAA